MVTLRLKKTGSDQDDVYRTTDRYLATSRSCRKSPTGRFQSCSPPRRGRSTETAVVKVSLLISLGCIDRGDVTFLSLSDPSAALNTVDQAVCYEVSQGNVLAPVLFLLYTADVLVIAACHGVAAHSYANNTQLYERSSSDNREAIFERLMSCIDDVGHYMDVVKQTDLTEANPGKCSLLQLLVSDISLPRSTRPFS